MAKAGGDLVATRRSGGLVQHSAMLSRRDKKFSKLLFRRWGRLLFAQLGKEHSPSPLKTQNN
jgi:hypothetical protein